MGNTSLLAPHTTERNGILCAGRVIYRGSDGAKNTGAKPGRRRTRPDKARAVNAPAVPVPERHPSSATPDGDVTAGTNKGRGWTDGACPPPPPGLRGRHPAGSAADTPTRAGPGPPDVPRQPEPPVCREAAAVRLEETKRLPPRYA